MAFLFKYMMHIEPTSRCILACPGCPRTWFAGKFHHPFPKQDLDLDDFARFMDCDSGAQVNDFLLNGNHGDPIYYPRLVEMIQRFRDRKFRISTNGSHMPKKFWHVLAENLTIDDVIYFSIDGLEHDNHLYRRNSDWNSIMAGLDIMVKSPAKVIWKSIIFSYNQHEIAQMEQTARDRGADFFSETTGYFGDDSLRPSDEKLIRTDMLYKHSKDAIELDPKCKDFGSEFVSADGYYWPCCLISNVHVLHKTQLWREKDQWCIDNQTLDRARQRVTDWANSVKIQGPNAPSPCKMHCKVGQSGYQWANH